MSADFTNRLLTTLNPYGPEGRMSRSFGLPAKFTLATRIYSGSTRC